MIPSNTRSTERNGHYCCYCHVTMSTSEIWRSLVCAASENPSTTIQIQSWWTNARRKCASSRHRRDSPTGKAHLLEKKLSIWKKPEGRSDRVVDSGSYFFWLIVVLFLNELFIRCWTYPGVRQETKSSIVYTSMAKPPSSFVEAFGLYVS